MVLPGKQSMQILQAHSLEQLADHVHHVAQVYKQEQLKPLFQIVPPAQ
jgi:hypothetical protein